MIPSLDLAEKVDLETTHRGYRLLTVFKTVPLPLGLLLFFYHEAPSGYDPKFQVYKTSVLTN